MSRIIDRRVPGARTSGIARTKFIDDAIESNVRDGIDQLIILGGGFDSRAYRLRSLRDVSVLEVDHPDTQAAKRATLQRLGVAVGHVHFVAIDFNERQLESVMHAAGYRASARTFVLWEGVTNYLTEPAVDTTLRWCARASPGSRVLFTYVHRDVLTRPESFVGTRNLFATLRRHGESWTFGIEPRQLAGFLAERGLRLEADLGANEYRERIYQEAARQMRGYEFYRIAVARVD